MIRKEKKKKSICSRSFENTIFLSLDKFNKILIYIYHYAMMMVVLHFQTKTLRRGLVFFFRWYFWQNSNFGLLVNNKNFYIAHHDDGCVTPSN